MRLKASIKKISSKVTVDGEKEVRIELIVNGEEQVQQAMGLVAVPANEQVTIEV